jgi:hypothetical protein
MPITLHLGVSDVPYDDAGRAPRQSKNSRRAMAERKRGVPRPRRRARQTATTGQVAEILEKNYSLFTAFAAIYQADIQRLAAEHLQGRLEAVISGSPAPNGSEMVSEIQDLFQKAIDNREFDSIIPGLPTGAARRGVNHRLAHPYAKGNPSRPSFLDRGQFQSHIRAWLDIT